MKKSIFALALLSVAVLFSACKDNKKGAVTAIALNPSELTLHPGEVQRLSLSVTPEDAKYNADDLVWESSDTAIAVVSYNGTVTAKEVGSANISVKLGDLTAITALTVKDLIDDLTFTGIYFGMADTAAYGNELDTIRSSAGDIYHVKLIEAYVAMFSAGFYLNKEYDFAGGNQGAVIETTAPMYWAPGWANGSDRGTIFCLGEWYILDTIADKCIPSGKVNELFIPNMKLFLENLAAGDQTTAYTVNLKDAGQNGCEGALMKIYQYHTTAEGYGSDGYYSSYIPDLFFQEGGYIYADDNYAASDVMCSIEGHHLTAKELRFEDVDDANFYRYGCYWHYDEASEAYSWNDEEVHFGELHTYDYKLDIFQSAAPQRRMSEIHNFGDIEMTKQIRNKINSVPTADNVVRKIARH